MKRTTDYLVLPFTTFACVVGGLILLKILGVLSASFEVALAGLLQYFCRGFWIDLLNLVCSPLRILGVLISIGLIVSLARQISSSGSQEQGDSVIRGRRLGRRPPAAGNERKMMPPESSLMSGKPTRLTRRTRQS